MHEIAVNIGIILKFFMQRALLASCKEYIV